MHFIVVFLIPCLALKGINANEKRLLMSINDLGTAVQQLKSEVSSLQASLADEKSKVAALQSSFSGLKGMWSKAFSKTITFFMILELLFQLQQLLIRISMESGFWKRSMFLLA